MELPTYITNSPTKVKIIELYPEGSLVEREEIGNAYILLSKSTKRIRKNKGGGRIDYLSIPASRRYKGVRFFKKMLAWGFWKEKV